MTRVAPCISGKKNSQTEISKLKGVFCSTRSAEVRGKTSLIQCRRLLTPRWGTITPLGLPVEPEVYRTYITVSGVATCGGATGDIWLTCDQSSSRQRIRPAKEGNFSRMTPCVNRTGGQFLEAERASVSR